MQTLTFSEWLVEEGKCWEAIKGTFSKRRKGLECKKKEEPKDEKKDLMSKLLSSKDREELASVVKKMRDKGLHVHNGKVKEKKEEGENLQKWMVESLDRSMKSFSEWYEKRLNEMSRRKSKKKKAQPVVMPKDKDNEPLTFKIGIGRAGHQQPSFRTGTHDQGARRQRTRRARNRKAIQEFD